MKKFITFFVFVLLGVGAIVNARNAPQVQPAFAAPVVPATWTPAVVTTPTPNVEMTMMFLRATDTIVAIQKTEQAGYSAQQTQAAIDFQKAVASTNQAQEAAAVATQNALQAQEQQTAQAYVMNARGTAAAVTTQTAYVAEAATQWYWGNVTATQLAATQEIERSAIQARQVRIWGWTIMALTVGALLLILFSSQVWRYWKLAQAEYLQASALEPDQHGRLPVVNTRALGKDNKLVNPNLAHRAVIDPQHDDLSTEQALANTHMHMELEQTRAVAESPAWMRQVTRKAVTAVTEPMPNANMDISKPAPTLLGDGLKKTASWSLMEGWDGKGDIPFAVSARGLDRLSLAQTPHGGIFGQTGKGKSRYFLRPFLAAAIASGQRVMILGKQADFQPFISHPNVKMLEVHQFTNVDEAARYAGYLKRMVEEMNRRDSYLAARHASTWENAGGENTLIVLDELGNALDMMPREIRQEAYRWVQGLVQEGRKAGFNVWLASQRAVGFKSIVEQLGRAVFYLADQEASRYALGAPGAETLKDGHFFAKFQSTRQCIAFDPTDDELARFLQARPVRQLDPVDWIEGTATDVGSEPLLKEDEGIEQHIRAVLGRMRQDGSVSLSQAQREVYGEDDPRGGKHFKLVQQIWVEMQAESATATTKGATTEGLAGSATGIATGSAL